MKTLVQAFCGHTCSFLWDKYQGVGLLGHRGEYLTLPPVTDAMFLPAFSGSGLFIVLVILGGGVSHAPLCSFFLMTNDIEHFHLFIGHLFILLWKLFTSFAHFLVGWFVFLLLSCRSSLYILDPGPLSDTYIVSIFFQSSACPLIFIVSFLMNSLSC